MITKKEEYLIYSLLLMLIILLLLGFLWNKIFLYLFIMPFPFFIAYVNLIVFKQDELIIGFIIIIFGTFYTIRVFTENLEATKFYFAIISTIGMISVGLTFIKNRFDSRKEPEM